MFLVSQEESVTANIIRSFDVDYFIGMPKDRIIDFQSRTSISGQPNIFSTYKVNKNEWYIKRYFNYNVSIEYSNIKLTEDDLLELKLRHGKLLILSEFRDEESVIPNILFTKFVKLVGGNNKHLAVNQYIKTLFHMIKPDAVVFEGSFESALISYIESISNFKYVPYEGFLDHAKEVHSLSYI